MTALKPSCPNSPKNSKTPRPQALEPHFSKDPDQYASGLKLFYRGPETMPKVEDGEEMPEACGGKIRGLNNFLYYFGGSIL